MGFREERESLRADAANVENMIRQKERAVEALMHFKGSVCRSQTDFNIANSHLRIILLDLRDIAQSNPVVKKYKNGMGDTLTGIGMKIVDASFLGLHAMIDLKIVQYEAEIAALSFDLGAKKTLLLGADIIPG